MGRFSKVSNFQKVEESLQDDLAVHLVLVNSFFERVRVVLEVLLQLLMVDRQERHTLIEVLGFFVEAEGHSLGVDEQLICVCLLLLDLKHLLLTKASLLSLEAFLGSTGVLFTFLVLLLFQFILGSLVSHADWNWLEVGLESLRDLFDGHVLIFGVVLTHRLADKLGLKRAKWKLNA